MELYSYFNSSSTFRVRIALNVKKIAYDLHPVHLLRGGGEQRQEEYLRLNPLGEVPFLKIDATKGIAQSLAIIGYLEETHPEPPLFPKDPFERARVWQACEIVNSGIQPLHNLSVTQYLKEGLSVEDPRIDQWRRHWITRGLSAMERFLTPHAGLYSFGDQVTAADCCLIPQLYSAERFGVSLQNLPVVRRIFENCREVDAFIQADPFHQVDSPRS